MSSSSHLVLHCGARQVSRAELDTIEPPAATTTWFPVKHATVIDTVTGQLETAGFNVTSTRCGLSRGDHRLFGTLELNALLATGVTLAVGVRNSTDQSFPLGFCAGNRCFVCDNTAFRSELLVKRKHTKNGQERFREAIALAVQSLKQFQEHEAKRIQRFQTAELTEEAGDALLLKSFETGIVSHRVLPTVIGEWRKPSFEEFQERNYWSLLNCFTTVLRPRAQSNLQAHAALTMRLGALLDQKLGLEPFTLPDPPDGDGKEEHGHAA